MLRGSPWFQVESDESAAPVYVFPWHVRSVRPIRHEPEDVESVTRIEFDDGTALDVSEPVHSVLARMRTALQAILDSIAEGVSSAS